MSWWRSRRVTTSLTGVGLAAAALLVAGPVSAAGAWHIVPSPNSGTINQLASAVAFSPTDVWAAGNAYAGSSTYVPLIEHFTGTTWQIVPSPSPADGRQNYLQGLSATSASNIWAVGWSLTSRSHTRPLVEHYDGSAWTIVAAPGTLQRSDLAATAAVSPSDVWAVGGQSSATSTGPALIEHYDGTSWTVVATPLTTGSLLESVAKVSATNLWAVGSQWPSGLSSQAGLAMHYDGTNWTAAAVAVPPIQSGDVWTLTKVSATSASDVWAIGRIDKASGLASQPILEHFDGTRWSLVQVPQLAPAPAYDSLDTLFAVAPGDLWVIGNGTTTSGQAIKLLEHYDGTGWILAGTLSQGSDSLNFNALTGTGTGQLWAVGSAIAPNTTNFRTLTALYP